MTRLQRFYVIEPRSVTPEVAGSSPVAPAQKVAANGDFSFQCTTRSGGRATVPGNHTRRRARGVNRRRLAGGRAQHLGRRDGGRRPSARMPGCDPAAAAPPCGGGDKSRGRAPRRQADRRRSPGSRGERRMRPRCGRLLRRYCIRGHCEAQPEQAGESTQTCRAQVAHARTGRSRQRGRQCSQRSTAPVMPMHDRVDGDRQLTGAVLLGGGLRSLSRAIGPTRPRAVRVAQSRHRAHGQRWPEEQDFRSGGEHQLDSVAAQFRASSGPVMWCTT